MNKGVFIIVIALLLGTIALYFVLNNGSANRSPNNETAIKVDPPQGWYLWEVLSAGMNLNEDTSKIDASAHQEYLSNWTRENSDTLVFTSSPVDLQTRDLSKLFEYANQRLDDPLAHDVIAAFLYSSPVDFSVEEQSTESITVMYTNIDGKRVSYTRMKAFDTHDVASISIPVGEDKSVTMMRFINKNMSDDEVLATFTAFEIK